MEHCVGLDCESKRMTFKVGDDVEVVMVDKHRDYLSNVISTLVDEKLTRKGCDAYLAYAHDTSSMGFTIERIHTIKDFSDVFSEELSGLPPDREVEFGIKLLPDTIPVSIAPYRMTPEL